MPGRAIFLPPSMRRTYAATTTAPKPNPSAYGMTAKYGRAVGNGRGDIGTTNGFGVSRQTFEQLEDFIRDCDASSAKAQLGIDALVRLMVLVIKGFAQERAAGPVAPRHRSNPALAFRVPVQRITGAYFAGWQHKKVGHAHWMVYNDAKEAYLIEYGIYQRTRRPVLKMSLIDMLHFISSTRAIERFADDIIAPLRNKRGQFQSFEKRLSNSFKLGLTGEPGRGASNPNIVGPSGRLPG